MSIIKSLILICFIVPFSCFAQNKKPIAFIFFDANSKETYLFEGELGLKISTPKYVKSILMSQDGSIDEVSFYIASELFVFKAKRNRLDTLKEHDLATMKLWELKDMKKIVDKDISYSLYPSNAFKKIYLIEKLNAEKFVKYEVEWQYYIE